MRKLLFGLSLVLLVSCVENVEEFIPNETKGPIAQLQKLIANKSLQIDLSSNESRDIETDYKSVISVGENIISNSAVDEYQLTFIELQSYQDYILQNVDHHSSRGAINSIYSFYVSLESEGSGLSLSQGNYIEIKIPYEELSDPVLAGRGSFESGNLAWDYNDVNLNSNLSYGEWLSTANDGSVFTEKGYIVRIQKSGWYNLVSLVENATEFKSVCISISDQFTQDNTKVYILSKESNYASSISIQVKEEGYHCSDLIPANTDSSYKAISISSIDNNFYYSITDVDLSKSVQYLNPTVVSLDELKLILDEL